MPQFDVTVKEIAEELIGKAQARYLECRNYWDAHGTSLWRDPSFIDLGKTKTIELWEKTLEYQFTDGKPFTVSMWSICADGEELSLGGEVMRFKPFKDKIRLNVCIGSG